RALASAGERHIRDSASGDTFHMFAPLKRPGLLAEPCLLWPLLLVVARANFGMRGSAGARERRSARAQECRGARALPRYCTPALSHKNPSLLLILSARRLQFV